MNTSYKKRALIVGISGQDGAYLAKLLLEKGYDVWGSSRDAQLCKFTGLHSLGIFNAVRVVSMSSVDFRSTLQTIAAVNPIEIYNLSGQSSVGLSFEQPVETLDSISTAVLNILEAIRFINREIRFYNAGSSEAFGDTSLMAADENTPFRPRSPYAVAKAAAAMQVAVYRDAYSLYACTGILFNHESPLRPERYVTRKIINGACKIASGRGETLSLGNIDISRDWGWAPEYVIAMWEMLQRDMPRDFVIGTGEAYSLREFIQCAFAHLGLDWQQYVQTDPGLLRPSEIIYSRANPTQAQQKLNWTAKFKMHDVVRQMIEYQLKDTSH